MLEQAFVPCLVASFVGHYVTVSAWGVKHKEKMMIDNLPDLSINSSREFLQSNHSQIIEGPWWSQ
ncbi:hypothetical protein SAMN05192533_101255 [Mesobacillus persicus]|uniref:Uncharacterized protein n=1 Tax=Mesobacillus persicus TaxID=930146 RepID=A0A1H7W555_9BACI|nr:hypothetical protein SAMN05192533_101255 [Mesobacillus persicus]